MRRGLWHWRRGAREAKRKEQRDSRERVGGGSEGSIVRRTDQEKTAGCGFTVRCLWRGACGGVMCDSEMRPVYEARPARAQMGPGPRSQWICVYDVDITLCGHCAPRWASRCSLCVCVAVSPPFTVVRSHTPRPTVDAPAHTEETDLPEQAHHHHLQLQHCCYPPRRRHRCCHRRLQSFGGRRCSRC